MSLRQWHGDCASAFVDRTCAEKRALKGSHVDVEGLLSHMEKLLAEGRPVPLSSSVMVNRADFDEAIAALRQELPEELRQSRWVLRERDEVLSQAQRQAEQVVAEAELERDRLVGDTEVARAARKEADRILEEAREQARNLRQEAEDYVDNKLANFEIVLQKTLSSVEKGRERLRGRLPSEGLATEAETLGESDARESGAAERSGGQVFDHESDQDRRR